MPRAAVSGLLRSVVTFAGYNLVFGAMSGRTDNAAHVGGLVSGLILGALIAKVAPAHDQPLRRVGVLAVGIVIALGGALWLDHTSAYALHTANGEQLLAGNSADQAIVELQRALKQRPGYVPAHFDLARAYLIKNDFAKAAAEFRRVVELDPREPNGWYSLGYTELEQKHPDQARQAFAQLLKLNPNSADGHAGQAAVFSFESKYSEALGEYQKAAQLEPESQSVYYDMGRMQSKLGLYDDAIKSFLKQRDNGDDPDNESALASVYEMKGMTKEAADARERAQKFQDQH
jgi:tetratricopeptide (TPR) repeat protein